MSLPGPLLEIMPFEICIGEPPLGEVPVFCPPPPAVFVLTEPLPPPPAVELGISTGAEPLRMPALTRLADMELPLQFRDLLPMS